MRETHHDATGEGEVLLSAAMDAEVLASIESRCREVLRTRSETLLCHEGDDLEGRRR